MSEAKRSWRDVLGRVAFWLVVAFVVFASVMTLVVEFMRDDSKQMDVSNVVNAAPVPKPDLFEANTATGACMLFIKKSLHDPDSAQFEHSNEASVFLSKNRAFVIRAVRAKNGFGAMRKDEFSCFLEMRGGDVFPVLIVQKGDREKEVASLIKEWGIIKK